MLIKGNGISLPAEIDPKNNICVVVTHLDGQKEWWYGSNIVTDDGDIYYAKKSAGETPSTNENFLQACCVLQNPATADTAGASSVNFKDDTINEVTTPILTGTGSSSWSVQNVNSGAGYPKTNDSDTDNTGRSADAVSYRFDWTTGQIDTGSGNPITGGAILDYDQVTSSAGSAQTITSGAKILTRWNFSTPSSFHKTSTDTLKLFVNHTFNGVG